MTRYGLRRYFSLFYFLFLYFRLFSDFFLAFLLNLFRFRQLGLSIIRKERRRAQFVVRTADNHD